MSQRKMIAYRVANWAWVITTWIWTTILLGFLVQFVPALFTLEDPVKTLPNTWAGLVINWLSIPSHTLTQEILRVIALGGVFLLVAIPPVAFMLKQLLLQQGFNKLIDLWQKDTISLQLELLQKQLTQQIQMQATSLEVLQHATNLLQQAPTSTILEELSQTLQEIQIKNSEQVQRLDNLSRQDQYTQEQVLVSLRNVTFLLEQMLVRPPLPDHRENESLSKRGPITDGTRLSGHTSDINRPVK